MRKIIVVVILIIISAVCSAKSVDKLVREYKNKDGVKFLHLSDMKLISSSDINIGILSLNIAGDKEAVAAEDLYNLLGIKEFKALTLDDAPLGIKQSFKKDLSKINLKGYELYMVIDVISFYVKEGKKDFTVLMYSQTDDCLFLAELECDNDFFLNFVKSLK